MIGLIPELRIQDIGIYTTVRYIKIEMEEMLREEIKGKERLGRRTSLLMCLHAVGLRLGKWGWCMKYMVKEKMWGWKRIL